jgi:hypothetical protein
MLWLKIETDGHLDLIQEFVGIIVGEFKAVAFSGKRVILDNGIVKPSGGADDWDRPIFQTIDLIQTAGLIFRWHQKKICSGFDLMG